MSGEAGAQQAAREVVSATIPSDSPGSSLPLGAKRNKVIDAKEGKPAHAVAAVAQSMTGVEAAFEDATARKASSAEMTLEAKLLEMVPNGSDTAQRVRDLLARAQQVHQVNGSGSAPAAPEDRGAGAAASAGESSGRRVVRGSGAGFTTEEGGMEGEHS